MPCMDTAQFRRIMGNFPTGVTIVTTLHDGTPHGMTANAVTPVSLDPLLMLFCATKDSRTCAMIRKSGVYAINILSHEMGDLADRFAGRYGAEDERFASVSYYQGATGAPIIAGNLAWLDCKVVNEFDGGDHAIFVAEVIDGDAAEGEPLVFCRGKYTTVAPRGDVQ